MFNRLKDKKKTIYINTTKIEPFMATLTDFQYYFVLFFLWLLSILLLRTIFKKTTTRRHRTLPPSPPSLPLIGHLHMLTLEYHKSIQRLAAQYGPLLYLRFAFLPAVLISSPSLAAEVFKTQDITLSGKPKSPFEAMFGNNAFITSQYGDYWKFMKKLCMTELLGTRQIQRTRGVRGEELAKMLKKLVEHAKTNSVVDVGGELMKLTNVIICRLAFSTKHSEEKDEAEMCRKLVLGSLSLAGKVKLASVLGHPLNKIALWLYGKQAEEVLKRSDEFFEKMLKEHEERARRESGDREDKDLMDILLGVHHDENAEVKITRNQIKAFIMDLFVAGTSTMADTMQWAMAELINHPNVFKKVREEIKSVVGDRLVEESDIQNLHYLQVVIKETLRLYAPLAAIPRATLEDCKIGGYDIPKGTLVLTNAYTMMRDPNVWENPDEFIPERFLTDSNKDKESVLDQSLKGLNFSYFPFGMGRRSCPGQGLALVATNVVVAALVQCFDWEVCGGEDGAKKINMEVGRSITTSMAHPLKCVPKIHFNPFST